jgi:hypothetical protein
MPAFLAHLLVLGLHTYGCCTSRKDKDKPTKNISKATVTKQKITQHVDQCAITDSTKSIPKLLVI